MKKKTISFYMCVCVCVRSILLDIKFKFCIYVRRAIVIAQVTVRIFHILPSVHKGVT